MSPETFTPNIVLKNPSLKDIGEFWSFEHELPVLAWCSKCCTFLHDHWCQ